MPRPVPTRSPRLFVCALGFLLGAALSSGCASSAPSDPTPPGNPRMIVDLGMVPLPSPPDLLGIDLASGTPRPDLAGMTACTVWPQSGCPAGFKCTTQDYSSTTCDTDGQAARGAACTQAPDSCKAGSLCFRDSISGATQCRQFCTSNTDCGARADCAIGLNVGNTLKVCTQACDPLAAGSCATGHACYLYESEHSDCVGAGSKAAGATCMYFDECQAGLTCINNRCRKVCKRASPSCDTGQTCAAITTWTSFGACCPSTGC
ncbi:MAG: hypothetical protein U1A78_28220 [Polyangia bacterium]